MARRGIITYGHPTLRQVAKEVSQFDETLHELIDDMVETMRDASGIGLAAPQINISQRLFVVDMNLIDEEQDYAVFINPEMTTTSETRETMEEGCLSIPGITEDVTRPERISLRYQDAERHHQHLDADGLLAVVIQHELDHLNGVLFIDHLSGLRQRLLAADLRALENVGLV